MRARRVLHDAETEDDAEAPLGTGRDLGLREVEHRGNDVGDVGGDVGYALRVSGGGSTVGCLSHVQARGEHLREAYGRFLKPSPLHTLIPIRLERIATKQSHHGKQEVED